MGEESAPENKKTASLATVIIIKFSGITIGEGVNITKKFNPLKEQTIRRGSIDTKKS